MNQSLKLEPLKAALEKGTKTSPLPWVDPYAHTGRANIIAWDLSDEEAFLATLAVNSLPALIEEIERLRQIPIDITRYADAMNAKEAEAEIERLREALKDAVCPRCFTRNGLSASGGGCSHPFHVTARVALGSDSVHKAG